MRGRCNEASSSIPVAVARLDRYKWIICQRHYANIVELPKGTEASDETTVWGLVYNMTAADEATLDLYEGHNYYRNPKPQPNPDPLHRQKTPYLQGGWDYNKHYLPVTVTKWLAKNPSQYGIDGRLGETITVLAYVDEFRTGEGVIAEEYIGRMNRAIDESAQLGVPRTWMDKIMRKKGWVTIGDYAPEEYVGDDRGYISERDTELPDTNSHKGSKTINSFHKPQRAGFLDDETQE